MDHLTVDCPYCSAVFNTPKPTNISKDPFEIECVPYTRDVGRFDPEGEEDWFDPGKWSRIGKDYLSWLNYEKIGILRITQKNINVQYRVQRCPECESLFDIYANYTEGLPITKIWPHLFERNPDNTDTIKLYYGESWPIWILRRLGKFASSVFMGAIIFGLLVYCLGNLPTLFFEFPSNEKLILNGIVSIAIVFLLLIEERYVHFVENEKRFYGLLKLNKPSYGLVHWRNYILCRFVGVQDGRQPHITQVDIISGGASVLLLFVVWIKNNLPNISVLYWIVELIVVIVIMRYFLKLIKSLVKSKGMRILGKATIMCIGVLLLIYGACFLGINQTILSAIIDLLYWSIFAYFVGTAGGLSLNTSFYVIEGLTRIPMNLSPYNNFKQAKPLRKLQSFSTGILLVLFISFLAIFYLIMIGQVEWLLEWLRLVLVFVFVAAGLGLKRGEYFGIAAIYVLVSVLPFQSIALGILSLDPRLIVIGFFFTTIVGYQIVKTMGVITNLLRLAKDNELENIDGQIKILSHQAKELEGKILKYSGLNDGNEQQHYIKYQSALKSIESLLSLRERVEKVSIRPIRMRQVSEFLAPLVSSILMPLVLDITKETIIKYIT